MLPKIHLLEEYYFSQKNTLNYTDEWFGIRDCTLTFLIKTMPYSKWNTFSNGETTGELS